MKFFEDTKSIKKEDITMVAQVQNDVMTSRNGRLTAGMTRENMQAICESESQRAAKKLMKAFEMADGSVDGIKDGVISEDEIKAYDKEVRKKNWRTGLAIAGGVIVAGIAAYLTVRGIQANKIKNMSPDELFDYQRNKALSKRARSAFSKVTPENFKGEGISYLVDAEASATPAYKLKMGKTVGETLALNKEAGLELVQTAEGKFVYGVKDPWRGWENLAGWKNEYGTLPFEELKKIYPELTADMYFRPAGEGVIKAYGAAIENGKAVIQKAYNGVPDVAFQVNTSVGKNGAKNLVNITHVYENGAAVNFSEMPDGWNMLRKGQYNPANPSQPLPVVQTVVGFKGAKDVSTLEGVIHTDVTMTDGGGFPYNKFKDFWKQATRGKVKVKPDDAQCKKLFEQAEIWKSAEADIQGLKKAGKGTEEIFARLEGVKAQCEATAKELIVSATKV